MGAWGTGTFDNDDAADWLDELDASEDETVLQQAVLDVPETAHGYLEAREGARILCAAEIIAALRGRPSGNLPEIANQWVEEHGALDVSLLVPIAVGKIDRILAEDSELKELRSENIAEYSKWRDNVLALKETLKSNTQ